jgi:hypothetical protein
VGETGKSMKAADLAVLRNVVWQKIAISDNVGGVKPLSSRRSHALVEERHFALVGGLRFPRPLRTLKFSFSMPMTSKAGAV